MHVMPPKQRISQRVQVAGDDFKSGQTKIKSVLVDYLVSAGIKVSSIVSYNHLGNNDGKNLSAPEQFRSKEISKSNVVDDMVLSNGLLCVSKNIPRYSSHVAFADTPRTSTPITLSSSNTCLTSVTASGRWMNTQAKSSWGERTLSSCTTLAKTRCLPPLSSSTFASWPSCVSASRTCSAASHACSHAYSVRHLTSCSLRSYNTPDMPAGSFQKVCPPPPPCSRASLTAPLQFHPVNSILSYLLKAPNVPPLVSLGALHADARCRCRRALPSSTRSPGSARASRTCSRRALDWPQRTTWRSSTGASGDGGHAGANDLCSIRGVSLISSIVNTS